ncbi:hypothetical protein GCM10010254_71970 [Streptomyces chromofuscus]|nr:hypothetical protein GCM10010254_71970 [Streptomyces chromofuscus]
MQLGAGEEVCALVTGTPLAVTGEENHAEERAAARGVRYRVVVERAVLDQPEGTTELGAALGRGEEVGWWTRCRRSWSSPTACSPWCRSPRRPRNRAALVVHASGLLELLAGLFESVWRQGLPLRLGDTGVTGHGPAGPDGTDLEFLSLLSAGLTDASVAEQLDLGLRTVQRRLMEPSGVTTRMQLGWHAYERGWVARER